jgi:hypothetical protein
LSVQVEARWREVDTTAAAIPEAWRGEAASAATHRLTAAGDSLELTLPTLVALDQTLTWYADRLTSAQHLLLTAADVAAATGVPLSLDGAVVPPGYTPAQLAAILQAQVGVRSANDLAALADNAAAARVAQLTARLATPVATGPLELVTPPCNAPPEQVTAWWIGLSPDDRWAYTRSYPALIGRMDGVPAADRDQANRLVLARIRQELAAQRAAATKACADNPSDASCRQRLDRVDNFLEQLDAINGRLQSTSGPRAYLLGIDTQGDGHAIVAIGDPNTADNVAAFVPGMGRGINNMSTEITRADRLVQQATVVEPHERTAAVVWIDYDRPPDLRHAASEGYAEQAERPLDRFVDGLRATEQNPGTHVTVVGHSYGSTVVGFAARDESLAADDLVFLGSPGVGAEHADQLNMPAARVWASTADHDIIRAATVSGGGILDLPAFTRPFFGESTERGWFGANPADGHFGGHVFASEPGSRAHPIDAHNAYFANGSQSLANIARIVVGGDRFAEVR